jgi:hypothetical protein
LDHARWTLRLLLNLESGIIDRVLKNEFSAAKAAEVVIFYDRLAFFVQIRKVFRLVHIALFGRGPDLLSLKRTKSDSRASEQCIYK